MFLLFKEFKTVTTQEETIITDNGITEGTNNTTSKFKKNINHFMLRLLYYSFYTILIVKIKCIKCHRDIIQFYKRAIRCFYVFEKGHLITNFSHIYCSFINSICHKKQASKDEVLKKQFQLIHPLKQWYQQQLSCLHNISSV